MEKQLKILSIGAHPDDADTYSGGLLSKRATRLAGAPAVGYRRQRPAHITWTKVRKS